jgi:2-phospho-L-lactate guanylyltransferase (CobY/MobA/RfbA family)
MRHDVDTADDLRDAAALGLGPATRAVLRDADLQLGAISSPLPGIMNP